MRAQGSGRRVGLPAFLICLVLGIVGAESALQADGERPKVGLALSGGGAKGGAHVGVLKVLEELRVPIDYISGTSMGAIIGGLYAAGLSVDELERILLETDWDDVLSDKPNRSELHFRRKEDDARYLLDLELGIGRDGLKWPAGLISGQKLYFMLQALTLPVAEVNDFDRLPIPFRCVATDIQNGEVVVLSDGNLASALRASMAIPTVFSPVRLDGRLLVDGGVTRNLPVDVVREMGADIVIAVDLGAELSSRDVDSLVRIYQQLSRIQIRTNVEPQLELADVVLKPAVTIFGTMEFAEEAEIIRLGRVEAEANRAILENYAVGSGEYRRLVARAADEAVSVLSEVRFEGNERVDSRIIAHHIRLEAGSPLELDAIGDDLSRLYGLGDFEAVTFSLDSDEAGRTLTLELEEKPWGPNFLHFGFALNTDFSGEASVGLLTNLTATRLNPLGAEWRSDLLVGTEAAFLSEFYQPLDFRGRWFVAPFVDFRRRLDGYWEGGRKLADVETRLGLAGVDIGYQATKYGEFRLGYGWGRASVSTESGELPEDVTDELEGIDLGAVRFGLTTDRLDSATFPRHGHRFRLDAFIARESLGSEVDYDRWEGRLSKVWSFGPNSVIGGLEGGWSPGSELPPYAEFLVGGFLSLSGFAEKELRGQAYGVARLGYYRQAFGSFFIGGFLEGGNVWQSSDEVSIDNLLGTATAFLGMDSRLGPVYLAYGQAEDGNGSVYLVFGRTF